MDIVTLRLLFVAGLVVLGGLASLTGAVVVTLTERVRSYRGAARGFALEGSPAGRP